MINNEDKITFATGSIFAGNFYTTLEVKNILGIGDYILNRWKDNGLSYNRVGKTFVFEGRDIQRYLRENKVKRVQDQ